MTGSGRFARKIAVVTGAAQGIGRMVAVTMAAEGGCLALVDRSDLVFEVREEIESAGGEAIAITADLEKYADCRAAMATAEERFNRIEILVNNVGGTIWAKPLRIL
jgi:dihydroxycyclohexadiene carboxylate dehydrogenase